MEQRRRIDALLAAPGQGLLDAFTVTYNTRRPHRSLPHRATPATAYAARPKATPGDRTADTHDHWTPRDQPFSHGLGGKGTFALRF